ncbi:hypothetical protein GCM10022200_08150 [Microbacterium awajiense]|uniref:Bacteriocin biosynthesis cyclodehydratase domain-containing protein n=1 Tax=Microbacterium awajiense TaxID=415214 RepID=A0ABP7AAD5_9MICO
MHRLDPRHPPLWRTATTLQFGTDAVAVVRDPAPWQERLIGALATGLDDDDVDATATAWGAPPHAGRRFLAQLRPALVDPVTAAPLVLRTALPYDEEDALRQALGVRGASVQLASGYDGSTPGIVVLAARHVVDPALGAALMRDDRAHLPIVVGTDRAVVGPLVVPGRTACLACLAMQRCERDAAWPSLAAQLLASAAPVPRALVWAAGDAAAHVLSVGAAGRSVELRPGSLRRRWRHHAPHAGCGCRSR